MFDACYKLDRRGAARAARFSRRFVSINLSRGLSASICERLLVRGRRVGGGGGGGNAYADFHGDTGERVEVTGRVG